MQDLENKGENNLTLSDAEMLRYARQILLDSWDIEAQTRIKNSQVIIVGMGGLGCPLAETLVRAGVGSIYLIDHDVIDESNLQRQSLFLPADIGKSKAIVASDRLKQINNFVKVEAIQARFEAADVINIINKSNKNSLSNIICDCTDNFKTRDHINALTVKQNIALLSASAIAQTGQLALFEPFKHTGCYHCLFHGEGDDERTCATSGVLASTTQIMGNLQAQAALTYLGLGKNPLEQTLLLWEGSHMNLRKLRFKPDPQCPVCASPNTTTPYNS